MPRNLSDRIKKVLGEKSQEALDRAVKDTPITTPLNCRDADVASIPSNISAVAPVIAAMGVSAEEAAKSFKELGKLLGGSFAEVTLTRPGRKRRPKVTVAAKDIHTGESHIRPDGSFEHEILVDGDMGDIQLHDRVLLTSNGKGPAIPDVSLWVKGMKRQGDKTLLALHSERTGLKPPVPETEEEGLDIGFELKQ